MRARFPTRTSPNLPREKRCLRPPAAKELRQAGGDAPRDGQQKGPGGAVAPAADRTERDLFIRRTRLPETPGAGGAAALAAFAEELVAGAALRGARQIASVVSLSLDMQSAPAPGTGLRGEVLLLREDGATSLWRARIADAGDAPVAGVSLTVVLEPARPVPESPPAASPRVTPAETATGGLDPRQAQIARAACAVIAEKGYAAASVREIADAAGMHVPTVYSHVKGKAEVLELVYAWTIGRMLDMMEPAFARGDTPPERLQAILRQLTEANDVLWQETGVLNRETRSLPYEARDRVLSRYYDGMVVRIAGVIEEGIASGHFRQVDPRLVANFLDALSDIWPLRPFAVGRAGIEGFSAELERFVAAALRP